MKKNFETIRYDKREALRRYTNPYPDRFPVNATLKELQNAVDGSTDIQTAGRITFIRRMGKLSFAKLADIEGSIQIAVKQDILGEELYHIFQKYIDIGDFVGVKGEIFTTRTGEKTIRVSEMTFLGKSLRPLPEKYHGINNVDACYRHRYLDLIMNNDTKQRFLLRSQFIKLIRHYLDNEGYIEIETPILINHPSGALAKPFLSHHNALDMDVYLRIAPETYLKRAIVGGFTKVYEVARCFRNEGIDASHLQDFTMLECYCAYYNYQDNMIFIQQLLKTIIQELFGTLIVTLKGQLVDFSGDWPQVSFRDIILKDTGIDINTCSSRLNLIKAIEEKGITLQTTQENISALGMGNLIDLLYKQVCRPRIIQPTFLTEHPLSLSPLARSNDNNPQITDRFQLIVNGAEIINAYSELVDPVEQYNRLVKQAELNSQGDSEAMVMDQDYIEAMEYGMPPISGWGIGIDRMVQILGDADNIKDTVLFPLMRPLENESQYPQFVNSNDVT